MGQAIGVYDPDKFDGGPLNDGLLPQYVKTAVNDFMANAACDIAGKMESGYRALGLPALANQLTIARGNAQCYTGAPPSRVADPNPDEISVPFSGGQCEGVNYSVTHTHETAGAGSFTRTDTVQGPLRAVYISGEPGDSFRQVIVRSGITSGEFPAGGGGNEFAVVALTVDSVSRLDGLPDDCGDRDFVSPVYPPGVELPPAPGPGDVIRPETTIEVTVEVDSNPVQITVPISQVIFNPDVGVEFSVGDINFSLSPSFSVGFSLFGGGTPDPDVKKMLMEIKSELEQELSGSFSGVTCGGGDVSSDYSGKGLRGLQSQGDALFLMMADLLFDQCPVESELSQDLQKIQIGSGLSGVNDVQLIGLSENARAVCLEIEGLPEGLRVYKPAGDQLEAPFGWMCVSESDGTEVWNRDNADVKTRKVFYPIGRPRGFDRSIRLSLKRGLQWTLFSLEVS